MSGYIGTKASVVTPGAERKKVFSITTTTTSLTGLVYTPGFVHVFHNGVRLVDGTDYTATNGTSITLTTAAQNGDEVVVISYATFQVADAYTKAESDARYVNVTGDTMTGALIGTNLTLSGGIYLGGTGAANLLDDYEEGTWTPTAAVSGFTQTISSLSNGYYRKIGGFVTAGFIINLAANGYATGYSRFGGLPFAGSQPSMLGRYASGSISGNGSGGGVYVDTDTSIYLFPTLAPSTGVAPSWYVTVSYATT